VIFYCALLPYVVQKHYCIPKKKPSFETASSILGFSGPLIIDRSAKFFLTFFPLPVIAGDDTPPHKWGGEGGEENKKAVPNLRQPGFYNA